jgi:crossover junction endodeoxyribonuclease RuvC
VLSSSHLAGLIVHEMSATAAKKSVTGYGRADKPQVALALQNLLKIDFGQIPLDASDALSLAYAHGLREMQRAKGSSADDLAGSSATWGQKTRKKQKGFETLLRGGQG